MQVTANTIALSGTTPNGQLVSGIGSQVGRTGSGVGGDITVETDSLTVTNGAAISSSAFGSGSAGNLDITAGTLQLDRGGITAVSASGDGANITLNVRDLLLMRRGSQISTNAGIAGAGGNGGNININSKFIVAVLSENSDITANAFTGSGGRVNITAQGIFGLKFQPSLTPFSDITARSQFGINGTVTLNLLNVDPSRGLVELPVNLTDPSQQISQTCTPGSKTSASSFVATGRGGIPLSPDEPLEGRAVVTKWVALPEEGESRRVDEWEERRVDEVSSSHSPDYSTTSLPLIEAQGLIVGTDGRVELVAAVPSANPVHFWTSPVPCQLSQGN